MIKKYLPWILIATGITVIAVGLFQRVSTIYYQNKYMHEYNEYISRLNSNEESEDIKEEEEENYIAEEMPEILINPDELEPSKHPIDGTKIIGIIEIPKININAAILEGTDDSALKYTVGHYPQTAQPGEIGNCVLLGHRNYVYGHFFRNLDKLEVGDLVILKKDTNTYTYKITESFVVSPEDTWVLNQSSNPEITMITCTPIGSYTHRLVVKGILDENHS